MKILKTIFIILGVIFLIFIIAIVLFFIFDPFNMKPVLVNSFSGIKINSPASSETVDKHPLLNEDQERMLETLGVDVENLPTQITPEMEKCLTEALGAERVKEIIGGVSPNPIDFLKAKNCLGQ